MHIPKEAPIEGKIDYGFLAEAYELTGGEIKNAVIRASYRSCADGGGFTQEHILMSLTAGLLAKWRGKLFQLTLLRSTRTTS